MDQGQAVGAAIAILAIVLLVATIWFVGTLRGIRRAAEQQVTLLQQQVNLLEQQRLGPGPAGQEATTAWRPSHLRR